VIVQHRATGHAFVAVDETVWSPARPVNVAALAPAVPPPTMARSYMLLLLSDQTSIAALSVERRSGQEIISSGHRA
jgi:hypothetical protein